MSKIKLALVHDDFIQSGGAEKFFLELIDLFKKDQDYEIEVFSSLISPKWKKFFKEREIFYQESFLKNFPFCYEISKFFVFFDFYYLAFQSFCFEDFDFVISSSARYAHSIITKPKTYHISYINSLPKMFWEPQKYYAGKKFLKFFIKNFFPSLRQKDFYTQFIPDLVVTNSINIHKKMKKYIRRNSIVLYPFIDNLKIKDGGLRTNGNYHLIISRLVSWKKIDFVISAFNKIPSQNLKIIGEGPMINYYKSISSKNIDFLGYVSEDIKIGYLKNSKCLIVPQDEDFGLIYVEAINYKVPVVYLNKGGATEILNEKVGVPFNSQDPESLLKSIELLDKKEFIDQEFYDVYKSLIKINTVYFFKKLLLLKSLNKTKKDNNG
jgi:hypothetical protein